VILFDAVRDVSRRSPGRAALSGGVERLTYGGLVDAVRRRADALEDRGTPIALDGGSPVAFVVDFFAARMRGLSAVAHPEGAPAGLRTLREAAAARWAFPRGGATAFFSSGSAGPSKAVPLSDENLAAAALAFQGWRELAAEDRVAIGLSPAQVLGFVRGALNALAAGAEAAFYEPGRDPLADAERIGATKALLPAGLVRLAAHHAARVPLAALYCGGGALDVAAADAVEQRRGVPVRAGYGMTESAGLAARQPLSRTRRPGTVGLAAPGMTVDVVAEGGRIRGPGEPGEVRLAGPAVFAGYLDPGDAPPFDAAGRLTTGDVGEWDEEGELRIRGRREFALVSGDRTICAEEVEAALAEHPAVAEAAAAALGHSFGVLVVSRDGPLALAEIRAFTEQRLPAFARPRRIAAAPELPRTAAGKIDRAEVSRWLKTTDAGA
jgi:acyl-CoA synthetase (AMP-forming)/AMP-acid ligase II